MCHLCGIVCVLFRTRLIFSRIIGPNVISKRYNSLFVSERFYDRPIGLQNYRIKNAAITASSRWDQNHAPWLARLHRSRRGRFIGAWSSRRNDYKQWLQVDMGRSMKVTGIATQGRQDADQWVTAYYVYISSDGVNFAKVKHWWNYVKVEYFPWHWQPRSYVQ